jgi:cytochrome b subunit of formate dehydrogenase
MLLRIALLGLIGLGLFHTSAGAAPQSGAKPADSPAVPSPVAPATKPAASTPASKPDASAAVRMPPLTGSHLAADKNNCIICHGEPERWDEKDPKSWRRYIPRDKLAQDVHWIKGVNCHDCHGGNPAAEEIKDGPHAVEDGFRKLPDVRKLCGTCHKDEYLELIKGVHSKAGEKNERGGGMPLDCGRCHGVVAHQLLPVHDSRSPVFAENQVKTCGECHAKDRGTYSHSAHGFGLYQEGLGITAVCANCHGAHGIYRAADNRSTLFRGNVATTCGKCHRYLIEELVRSVHGQGKGLGEPSERVAPGGKLAAGEIQEHPSCTSCHQNHEIFDPKSGGFRTALPNVCGNCHAGLSSRYRLSIHGELTRLGYAPAAKCSDCHGSHDILMVSNPASHLSPANRLETCRKCHPNAVANFAAFDPHADHTDAVHYPLLHGIYTALMTLMILTFGAFGLHCVLWFIRGLIDVLKHGRPKSLVPGSIAYVRFSSFHRRGHALLLISFLGLVMTGLPLKYSEYPWAKHLADALGGFDSTGFWHRVFALTTFACFAVYMNVFFKQYRAVRKRGQSAGRAIFGPDSPMPNFRDVTDLLKMLGWFFGLCAKPKFERWTYFEKFDFWGAVADVVIIGGTGLMLWFPNVFCRFLPGSVLNVAKVIHSTQALLATGFVFAIHFFSIHFRAEKFPADMSLLVGLVSEEEMQEERPEYFERLRREGRLEQLRATVPSRTRLILMLLLGFAALGVGMALLAAVLAATLGG